MREILFRGKLVINNEWEYSRCPDGILHSGVVGYDFIPETVGQFTGVTDKNGKKIFEGDIVQLSDKCQAPKGFVVSWSNFRGGWTLDSCNTVGLLSLAAVYPLTEVIGNIHDNPVLLSREA